METMLKSSTRRVIIVAAAITAIFVVLYVLMASGDGQGHCVVDRSFGECSQVSAVPGP
jgi:hypothetical protein